MSKSIRFEGTGFKSISAISAATAALAVGYSVHENYNHSIDTETSHLVDNGYYQASSSAKRTGTETVPISTSVIVPTYPNTKGASNSKTIPQSVTNFIDRDTVYLPDMPSGNSCSGRALRSKAGQFLGVITAFHCGLMQQDNSRVTGSNNRQYIEYSKETIAYTGSEVHHLKKVGIIDQFIVPNKNDLSSDIALGVAKGHTSTQVLKAFYSQELKTNQIANMKPGTTIYDAGWPQFQPKEPNDSLERQTFELHVLDESIASSDEGESNMPVIWTSTTATTDGASCSYGNSGSSAFVMVDGHPKGIGDEAVFFDLTGKIPENYYYGDPIPNNEIYNGPANSIVADCGFSYVPVKLKTNGEVLNIATSTKEIPGYVSPEQAYNDAQNEINDPTTEKTVIQGTIGFPDSKTGRYQYVNNPILFTNNKNPDYVGVGWAEAGDRGDLGFAYYDASTINELVMYPNAGTDKVSFFKIRGEVTFQQPTNSLESEFPYGQFSDSNGYIFGQVMNSTSTSSGTVYTFAFKPNGTIELEASTKG